MRKLLQESILILSRSGPPDMQINMSLISFPGLRSTSAKLTLISKRQSNPNLFLLILIFFKSFFKSMKIDNRPCGNDGFIIFQTT